MVRTRKSIEEEQRVRLLDQPLADPVVLRQQWLDAFEHSLVEKVVKWGARPLKRALVVGLEDRGDLALRLLKEGMFVTVVDPDKQATDRLNQDAESQGLGLKLNVFTDNYIARQFAISSFDLVCIYSVLARYSEPFVVIRKAKRELKAGAQLFARFRTRPDLPKLPDRVPGVVRRFVLQLGERLSKWPIMQENLIRLPTTDMVIEQMGKEFKIQDTVVMDTLAVPMTLAMGRLGVDLPIDRVAPWMNKLDGRLPDGVRRGLGGMVAVFAIKEKELGSTFRVR